MNKPLTKEQQEAEWNKKLNADIENARDFHLGGNGAPVDPNLKGPPDYGKMSAWAKAEDEKQRARTAANTEAERALVAKEAEQTKAREEREKREAEEKAVSKAKARDTIAGAFQGLFSGKKYFALQDYNKNFGAPNDLNPLRAQAAKYEAEAAGYLRAAEDDNTHLEDGAMPTGADRAVTPFSSHAPTEPEAGPPAANYYQAIADAAREQYEYNREVEKVYGALKVKLDNAQFDLKSQLTQLTRSVGNLPPEKQMAALRRFFDSTERNAAYSPNAPGITPMEKEARATILNNLKQNGLAAIQQSSMDTQKSQALSDTSVRAQSILSKIAAGDYEKDNQKAYTEMTDVFQNADQYLNPQQRLALFTDMYKGITEGLYDYELKQLIENSAGQPIYSIAAIEEKMELAAGFGGAFFGEVIGQALREDFAKTAGQETAQILADAENKASDYNRGVLDLRQADFMEAVENGNASLVNALASDWKAKRDAVRKNGLLGDRDFIQTKDYFEVVSKKDSGSNTSAEMKLFKNAAEAISEFHASDGKSPYGMNAAKALEACTTEYMAMAEAAGQPVSEAEAKERVRRGIVESWAGSDSKLDPMARMIRDIEAMVEEFVKQKVKQKDLSAGEANALESGLLDAAYTGLIENIFGTSKDASHGEIETRRNAYTTEFIGKIENLLDTDNRVFESVPGSTRPDIKSAADYLKKAKEAGDKLHIDPMTVLPHSSATDYRALTAVGVIQDLIAKEGEGYTNKDIDVVYNNTEGRFEAVINGLRANEGGELLNIERHYAVAFNREGDELQLTELNADGELIPGPVIIINNQGKRRYVSQTDAGTTDKKSAGIKSKRRGFR